MAPGRRRVRVAARTGGGLLSARAPGPVPARESPPAGLTPGEAWARDELERLRAAGYSPRAILRFLHHSQRRANERRRARPATARRVRLWVGVGAGAWAALALGGYEPFRRRSGAFVAWWGLTGLMLDWHIGMIETEDGRPRNLGPADACTLARVWLAPAAADTPAPWMCAVAFVTDGLDGRLARASAPTRIGRDLEVLADAAFAAAALRGALRRGWLGRGAAIAELLRLGIGLGYALAAWFSRADAPDPRVLHAGRLATPVRACGLMAAGVGRRRLAGALVVAGASWSAAAATAGLGATVATPRRNAGSDADGARDRSSAKERAEPPSSC